MHDECEVAMHRYICMMKSSIFSFAEPPCFARVSTRSVLQVDKRTPTCIYTGTCDISM